MKAFANLVQEIDETNKTLPKIEALANYFKSANDQDRLWAIAMFTSRRPKRSVNTTLVRTFAAEMVGIPLWLFEESYTVSGDLAETIALLANGKSAETDHSFSYWVEYIIALKDLPEEDKKRRLWEAWKTLNYYECFVFTKILTGGFRIGVSAKTLIKGLSKAFNLEENHVALRLTGNWTPHHITFEDLLFGDRKTDDLSKPYPFFLAYPIEDHEVHELGEPNAWQAEHKWDGIRGQIIKRNGQTYVWTRGGELVTEKYPEFQLLGNSLPDGVSLDGEILPFKKGRILPFNDLQTRIGRKNLSKSLLEKVPVCLFAYDLLEWEGEDIREWPLERRRGQLEELVGLLGNSSKLTLSPLVDFQSWDDLATERERSRQLSSEGIMLKRKASTYQTGRKKGDWWKWKVEPYTIDAVLTYAMRGSGRRANLYTDYTFALWQHGELVTFAKAYSGLTDEEFRKVDQWIKRNTLERYGPVRQVKPELVFELAFEAIAKSSRHKSGFSVRFPRIARWRHDKTIHQANSLEDLEALLG